MAYFTQMIDTVLLGYIASINAKALGDSAHKYNPYHWWTRRHLQWERGWTEGKRDYAMIIQSVYNGGTT